MKYLNFKNELYRLVSGKKSMEGMRVRILERDCAYLDAETRRLVEWCGLKLYEDGMFGLREDLLCVVWGRGRERHILHWNINELYEQFLEEGWKKILPEIFAKLPCRDIGVTTAENAPQDLFLTPDRTVIRLLNYQYHQEELDHSVFWRFGDIALVLSVLLYEGVEECSAMIYGRAAAEKWKCSDDVLLTNALLHSSIVMPPRIDYCVDRRRGIRGYRLTTAGGMQSAVSLFYPGMKEKLADRFRGDYYVGFASVHEVMLRPVRSRKLGELKEEVMIEKYLHDRREFLTDRVYRYCSEYKRLIEV